MLGECCSCSCHAELARCRAELVLCKHELRVDELASRGKETLWQTGTGAGGSSGSPPMDPLLTDYLPPGTAAPGTWLEGHQQELEDIANGVTVHGMQLGVNVWQFAPMQPGETLQDHVQRQVQGGSCPGPESETSLTFKSSLGMAARQTSGMQEAARTSARTWRTVATFRSEWQALLKNLLAGKYDPIVTRTVLFGDAAKGTASRGFKFITWPAVIIDSAGQRHWGMVQQAFPASQAFLDTWRLRDFLTVKHTPSCITIVAAEGGAIMWQNAASMAAFGVHGYYNTSIKHGEGQAPAAAEPDAAALGSQQYNFMAMIFESNKGELDQMKAAVQGGDTFRTQVDVVHPTLRSLMGLREGEEAHHDVQMSLTRDPVTLQQVYIVAQIDVTAAVLAKRQVQLAHAQLEEEKVRTEVLLRRQYELVECLGWVCEVGRSAAGDERAAELIDSVRRQIAEAGAADCGGEKIELLQILGEGSFGKVYKGLWRGKAVAVKSIVLPKMMNGSERKERMAVMEAAISSSLSHPNIVQTYTYSLKPVKEANTARAASTGGKALSTRQESGNRELGASAPQAASTASAADSARSSETATSAFEVQIVLELCDRGTLRDALALGAFMVPDLDRVSVNYPAVLEVAADIARGMQHLHACNILHSDLKAANVLLQSNVNEAKGLTAKVADFGLSVQMSSAETHVSGLYQGTVTHMAPETLLCGLQSNAADVYAFGITLWELYTGERPYLGVPRAHLGYQVSKEHLRPLFPHAPPAGYQALAERCWDASPAARPSFAEILEELQALREAEGGVTPRLHDGAHYAADAGAVPLPRLLALHPVGAAGSSSGGAACAHTAAAWPNSEASYEYPSVLVMGSLGSEWMEGTVKPAPPPVPRHKLNLGLEQLPGPPALSSHGPKPEDGLVQRPGDQEPKTNPPPPPQAGSQGHPGLATAPPADDSLLGNSCLVITSASTSYA